MYLLVMINVGNNWRASCKLNNQSEILIDSLFYPALSMLSLLKEGA